MGALRLQGIVVLWADIPLGQGAEVRGEDLKSHLFLSMRIWMIPDATSKKKKKY